MLSSACRFGSIATAVGQASSGGAPAPYLIDAVNFDSTDRMTATLVGPANSKLFTLAVWFLYEGSSANSTILQIGGNTEASGVFRLAFLPDDTLQIIGRNAALTTILDLSTSATFVDGRWHQVLVSVDLTGAVQLYIDGFSDLVLNTFVNDTINFAAAVGTTIGSMLAGVAPFTGGLAQVAFLPGVYVDLSVQANLDKFRSVLAQPVNLGADGSTAFGAPALVLQNILDGEAPANFATNAGTGGNFLITGTLTTYPSSPSG